MDLDKFDHRSVDDGNTSISETDRHRSVHGRFFSINMPAVLITDYNNFDVFRWSLSGLDAYGYLNTSIDQFISVKMKFTIDYFSISIFEQCKVIYIDHANNYFGISFASSNDRRSDLLLTFLRAYVKGDLVAISSQECTFIGPQRLSEWEFPIPVQGR